MDVGNDIRAGDNQKVIVAPELMMVALVSLTPEVVLCQPAYSISCLDAVALSNAFSGACTSGFEWRMLLCNGTHTNYVSNFVSKAGRQANRQTSPNFGHLNFAMLWPLGVDKNFGNAESCVSTYWTVLPGLLVTSA